MRKRTAFIHVGLEKTGSTALQQWLHANRQGLLSAGVLVPTSIGSPNHTRLVAASLDDGVVDNIKSHLLSRSRLGEGEFRQRVWTALDAELSANPFWDRLVITSELISSRLFTPSEIARLLQPIMRHVDEVRFVVFLRRQDRLAVSRFSSALRAGHSGFDDVFADLSKNSFIRSHASRSINDMKEFFDFETVLGRFDGIEDTTIEPLLYDFAPGRGPVDLFCEMLGLVDKGDVPGSTVNQALSAQAQYIVSELNRTNCVLLPDGTRNVPYRSILTRIENEVGGNRRTVSRLDAERFLAGFDVTNRSVAERYFGRKQLFRSDMEGYPEVIDYSSMMIEAAPRFEYYRAEAQRGYRGEGGKMNSIFQKGLRYLGLR